MNVTKAAEDARGAVLAYLQSIGKVDAFEGFDKTQMVGLIHAAYQGVQSGLDANDKAHDEAVKGAPAGGVPFSDPIPFAPETRA